VGARAAFADPSAPAAVNPTPTVNVVTAAGPTTVPSAISSNVVWGPQGSPYLVSSLVINKSGSVTLLPGTVVKLQGGAAIVVNPGSQLLALGTPSQHVVFTSIRVLNGAEDPHEVGREGR
jgi:hypothetical protein